MYAVELVFQNNCRQGVVEKLPWEKCHEVFKGGFDVSCSFKMSKWKVLFMHIHGTINDLSESLPGRTRTLSIIDSSKPFCANPSFLHLKGVRNQSPFPVHVSTEMKKEKKKRNNYTDRASNSSQTHNLNII